MAVIECDCCGDRFERKALCSGACRMKWFRSKGLDPNTVTYKKRRKIVLVNNTN